METNNGRLANESAVTRDRDAKDRQRQRRAKHPWLLHRAQPVGATRCSKEYEASANRQITNSKVAGAAHGRFFTIEGTRGKNDASGKVDIGNTPADAAIVSADGDGMTTAVGSGLRRLHHRFEPSGRISVLGGEILCHVRESPDGVNSVDSNFQWRVRGKSGDFHGGADVNFPGIINRRFSPYDGQLGAGLLRIGYLMGTGLGMGDGH